MHPIRNALAAILVLSPAAAFAQLSDSDIVNKLHSINQAELNAAALATSRTENKGVRKFAKQMTTDHTKADGLVVALAARKHLALAVLTPEPSPLEAMKDSGFDRAYLSAMIKGHGEALVFLSKAAADTTDADLKALVAKLTPTVAHHKKMAEGLAGGVSAMNDL